jgi:precorrin-6A/cobalt-precorrin-6A reductase
LQQGPFSVEAEIELMRRFGIEAIVSKNSGGNATYAKIVAARELAIPVVMIPRPMLPETEIVDSIDAALDWLRSQI